MRTRGQVPAPAGPSFPPDPTTERRARILGDHPIDVVLLATDLHESKEFYAGKLGLEIQEYDMPGLKTQDGVVDLGFALMAWIVDPHRNALAILQLK